MSNSIHITTLAKRNLKFYWRTNLGVLLGVMITSAVLIGALAVGDSIQGTLHRLAEARLGRVQTVLAPEGRYFRAEWADELARAVGPKTQAAPLMFLEGSAQLPDGSARANRIQVLGVDDRFFSLAPGGRPLPAPSAEDVFLNPELAAQLGVSVGDTVLLLVPKPSLLPREAVLAKTSDATKVLRKTVARIVTPEEFSRFSLQASQIAPFNAFVSREAMGQTVDQLGRANMMLLNAEADESLSEAIDSTLQLADMNLSVLTQTPAETPAMIELRSGRIFIASPVVQAAREASPHAQGVLTYLVNGITHGETTAPYSMVSAVEPGGMFASVVPQAMADDEIVLNQWLAEDLNANPGDEIVLRYYALEAGDELKQEESTFRVRAVVPLKGIAADASLMPEFPGIAGKTDCAAWDASLPIQTSRIRDKDEEYWDQYQGAPKAFLTLSAGQKIWANRFGRLTAVRYPADDVDATGLRESLRAGLVPETIGFSPLNVAKLARRAATESMDFGGLFVSLSFFLIAAALLLTALLMSFNIEQRTGQIGTLLAVGYRPIQVTMVLMSEGKMVALLGALLGIPVGLLYTQAMIGALSGIWAGAVASFPVHFHVTTITLVGGALGTYVVAALTLYIALRRLVRKPARELLAGYSPGAASGGAVRWSAIVAGALLTAAVGITVYAFGLQGMAAAGAFFGSGALLLIGGVFFCHWLLRRGGFGGGQTITWGKTVWRGASRRMGRSLTSATLLAVGIFLTISVNAFRLDVTPSASNPSGGTGGFALWARSAQPVFENIDTEKGRKEYRLRGDLFREVSFVPARLREGDDASCLNLNRPQTPTLLGVDPAALAKRNSFRFLSTIRETDAPWRLLHMQLEDGSIPVVADEPTLTWALGKKVGESIEVTDESGRTVRLTFVGAINSSILQGKVLLSSGNFVKLYPSLGGYRVFLIDAPPEKTEEISSQLSRNMEDTGLSVEPTTRTLARFQEVQNTYLSIFTVIGALGLLVGSGGFGIVVLRNVLERRGELALLRAVGFPKARVRGLVVREHVLLIALGVGCGLASTLIAVAPSLVRARVGTTGALVVIVVAFGLAAAGSLFARLAAGLAVRGNILASLRQE